LESTFTEFAERSEKLFTPLIAERDEYMAAKLKQVAARPPAARPTSVLVVIGAGHLKGMMAALSADAATAEPIAAPAARLAPADVPASEGSTAAAIAATPQPAVAGSAAAAGDGDAVRPDLRLAATLSPTALQSTLTRLEATPPAGKWVK